MDGGKFSKPGVYISRCFEVLMLRVLQTQGFGSRMRFDGSGFRGLALGV